MLRHRHPPWTVNDILNGSQFGSALSYRGRVSDKMNVEGVPESSFLGGAHVTRRENELIEQFEFDRARINVVRGTGGTHHGPARLVPRGRLQIVL